MLLEDLFRKSYKINSILIKIKSNSFYISKEWVCYEIKKYIFDNHNHIDNQYNYISNNNIDIILLSNKNEI